MRNPIGFVLMAIGVLIVQIGYSLLTKDKKEEFAGKFIKDLEREFQ